MKRWIAMMMAAMMMALCMPALAESYTVDEKFWGQAKQNAVKGTVTFAVNGSGTKAMELTDFQKLKDMLQRTEMSFGISTSNRYPHGGYVNCLLPDGSENGFSFTYNEEAAAIWDHHAEGDETYYLFETDVTKLLALFEEEEEKTPGIFEMLEIFEGADAEWKERAKACLAKYETIISVWMNDYAGTAMGKEGDTLYSELSCTIPVNALKGEIKALLHNFYQDAETLAVLNEVLQGTGAEIYLHPAMESAFAAMVENALLEGEAKVVRRFDSTGELVLDSISLPLDNVDSTLDQLLPFLAPFEKWTQITFDMTGKGDISFLLESGEQEKIAFTMNALADGTYQGNFALDVRPMNGEMQHTGYNFTCSWQEMEETYSLQTDILERLMQGTLTLQPDSETDHPAQRITLDMKYTTTSNEGSVAHLEANLVWMDVAADATIALTVNASTSRPFDGTAIGDMEKVIYLQDLPYEERQSILQKVLLPLNQAVTLPEL